MTSLTPCDEPGWRGMRALPKHGSPADRGSADAYYERAPRPHKMIVGQFAFAERIELTEQSEIDEYMTAFTNEEDRKDWGQPE